MAWIGVAKTPDLSFLNLKLGDFLADRLAWGLRSVMPCDATGAPAMLHADGGGLCMMADLPRWEAGSMTMRCYANSVRSLSLAHSSRKNSQAREGTGH